MIAGEQHAGLCEQVADVIRRVAGRVQHAQRGTAQHETVVVDRDARRRECAVLRRVVRRWTADDDGAPGTAGEAGRRAQRDLAGEAALGVDLPQPQLGREGPAGGGGVHDPGAVVRKADRDR